MVTPRVHLGQTRPSSEVPGVSKVCRGRGRRRNQRILSPGSYRRSDWESSIYHLGTGEETPGVERQSIRDAGLTGTTLHDPHHSIGRGLLQGCTCDIDNRGQRAQERATRPQGGDVFLSVAGRLSVTRNHATVWIIEYWVREFHHDSDTEAQENQPRVLWENSDNHALYSKTRDLTPICICMYVPPIHTVKRHLCHIGSFV